ncbi:Meiotic nuclear division protein 1 [Pichia californica]|uniref:Meiotic nuclear division protein 1 n=1 Tax=Pichia californica TaxID=460514 RepID=A0A9P6WIR0_9ASCO|nr:Meiotic nuclear division protein 1 [[Candida] californica]KAG0687554.1 Meiotic nuclear division protein 1 [[Candida] californica]
MYNIKEIETIASKKTGISSMQIKDILKLLTDESLVNCEKCGISNIYWSFKYNSVMRLLNDFNNLNIKKEKILINLNSLNNELKLLKFERSKISKIEKNKLLLNINKLKNDKLILQNKFNNLISNSPDIINSKKNNLKILQNSIIILIDNIEILINFIFSLNPNGLSKHEIREYFKIPQDL